MSNAIFPSLAGLMWDVVKSPRWNTRVQQSVGGKETRAQYASVPIYRWQLRYELLRASAAAELQTLVAFFNARRGQFDSFLFSDPSDNTVTLHGFGVGDGSRATFPLQRAVLGLRQVDATGSYPVATLPRTNMVLAARDLNGPGWTADAAGVTVVTNAALGPDGVKAASLLVQTSSAGTSNRYANIAPVGVTIRTPVTLSFSARAPAGAPQLRCSLSREGGNDVVFTTVSPTSSWQRFTLTHPDTWTSAPASIIGAIFPFNLGDQIEVDCVQIEVGSSATAFIPTTTSAVTVAPSYLPATGDGFEAVPDLNGPPTIYRIDWQGTQPQSAALRTNGLSFSEQFDNAAWTLDTATIGANAITAPDGTLTADKVQETATTGAHAVGRVGLPTHTPGLRQAYSVHVKAAERGWARLITIGKDSVVRSSWINLSTASLGTVDPGHAITLTLLPFGWIRVGCVYNTGLGGFVAQAFVGAATADGVSSYLGTAGSGIYVWGAQFEPDSAVVTSYLGPTTSGAMTRTDYTLSSTGVVTPYAVPAAGVAYAWSGAYYWRVRFDQDQADFTNFLYQLWEAKSVALVSVKG